MILSLAKFWKLALFWMPGERLTASCLKALPVVLALIPRYSFPLIALYSPDLLWQSVEFFLQIKRRTRQGHKRHAKQRRASSFCH